MEQDAKPTLNASEMASVQLAARAIADGAYEDVCDMAEKIAARMFPQEVIEEMDWFDPRIVSTRMVVMAELITHITIRLQELFDNNTRPQKG